MDLQLLSECGSTSNCLSRSVPEIHWPVAGTLIKQPGNQVPLVFPISVSVPVSLSGNPRAFVGNFFFFFCVPQLYLWGSPLLGEIFAYVTVF